MLISHSLFICSLFASDCMVTLRFLRVNSACNCVGDSLLGYMYKVSVWADYGVVECWIGCGWAGV